MGLHGIQERHAVRKATADSRIEATIDLVAANPGQWILWCGLNDEANKLAVYFGDSCRNVQGSEVPSRKPRT